MSGSGNSGAIQRSTWVTIVVAVVGLLAVVGAFGIAVFGMDSATDATAVLAPVLTVIGTLVGGIVGVRVGSEGKEQVQNELMGTVQTMTSMSTTRDEGILKANEQLLESAKAREEFAVLLATRATQLCAPAAAPASANPCCTELGEINVNLKSLIDTLRQQAAAPAAPVAPAAPSAAPVTLRLDQAQLDAILEALAKLGGAKPQ